MAKETKLKVAEAIQDDVNKGIVRIDSSYMHQIDVRPGDIVEINGERATVGIADRAYPGDIGLNIIRLDGILRRNAKTSIGELVTVKKADVKEAKKVIIAPARKGVMVRASPIIFKQGLLGRAVMKGDVVSLGGTRRRRNMMSSSPFFDEVFNMLDENMAFGLGDLKFIVAQAEPKEAVIITENTQVEFNPEAVEIEEKSLPEVTYEDIGGLEDEVKKVREMVELPLKYPEIFERLGIEPPKGVLLHGPPGTGKTLLAKAVASETNSNFYLINGPEIMSKYYGQSVIGSEKVVVRQHGTITRMPIQELVETQPEDAEALCFSPEGNASFQPITAYMKHKPRSDLVRVTTKTGRAITVTKDHSLFTMGGDGTLQSKPTQELVKEQAYLAVPRTLPVAQEIQELDLLSLLKKEDYGIRIRNQQELIKEAIDVLGREQAARLLGVTTKYTYDIVNKNIGVRAATFLSLLHAADIEYDSTSIQLSTKGKSMPAVLRLNEAFGLFLGWFVAEGSYTNKNEVRLSVHEKELAHIKRLCNALFGHVTTYIKPDSHGRDVFICSGVLGKVLRDVLGFPSGAKNKRLPDFVFSLPREARAGFLRGYISGDGTVNVKAHTPQVEVCTESPALADDIMHLLLTFGIVAKVYDRPGRPQKRIVFGDKENLERFQEIGFVHAERNAAIATYVHNTATPRRDRIPNTGFAQSIIENTPSLSAYKTADTIGRNVLLAHAPQTRSLLENDVYWDQIASAQEVAPHEYVYDIEVSGNHNFVAGFGGIIAHNSEENLRKKFEEAEKNAPSIIFIDEIDAIASKREESKGEVERRVVAQLLAIMDGLKSRGKVVVIAATNIPNQLDPALRRPGRFDREIEIGVPQKEGRLNILKIHTRNMPLSAYYPKEFTKALTKQVATAEKHLIKVGSDPKRLAQVQKAKKLLTVETIREIERGVQQHSDRLTALSSREAVVAIADILEKHAPTLAELLYEDILVRVNEITRQESRADMLEGVADVTHGFVGADLAALTREAAMTVLRRVLPDLDLKDNEPIPQEVLERLKISREDILEALKTVRPSAMREVFVESPNVTWDEIGGLGDIKQELVEAVEWPLKKRDVFTRMGIKPPKGVLMYGAPGTGKTLLAKAVASQSEANFILVKGPELLSQWVGESERAVRQIFEKARQASPSIIFFDEIDSLAPKRGSSKDNNVTERVVNQLLTEIDGLQELTNTVIIGATNRPDILDPALLRPGRFDRIVHVPVPDAKARKAILHIHLSGVQTAPDVSLQTLVDRTEGYVGADLEALVREAALLAVRADEKAEKVSMTFFEEALDKVQPSVTEEIEQAYKEMQSSFRRERANELKGKPSYYG